MNKEMKHYIAYTVFSFVPLIIFLMPNTNSGELLGEKFLTFLTFIPYFAFLAIGFLGLKLNQTRILFTAMILLLAYHFLLEPEILKPLGIGKIRLRQILSLSVPLGLSLLFSLKEAPLWDWRSALRFALGWAPILFFSSLFMITPFKFNNLSSWEFIPFLSGVIPQLSYIALLVLGIFTFINKDTKIKPFMTAILFSFIAFYTASYVGIKSGIKEDIFTPNTILCFSAVSFILLHAIYQMYWQRVYIDELTAIPNRRALDEKLLSLNGEYAIAMIDIDHFKKFNDTYGHDEGDNVLKLVAKTLESVLHDKVYRYGGEEFCAVFKGLDSEDAQMYANKARRKLESRDFHIRGKSNSTDRSKADRGKTKKGKKVKVTISIGVSAPDDKANTATLVIKKADNALYKAKEKGRNCVVAA